MTKDNKSNVPANDKVNRAANVPKMDKVLPDFFAGNSANVPKMEQKPQTQTQSQQKSSSDSKD